MADSTKSGHSDDGHWVRIKKVGIVIAWFATLVGSVVTIIQAFPVLTQTAKYAIETAFYPRPENIETAFYPRPENLAVFVSDNQPFATQYLAILAEKGFKTGFVPLSELNNFAKSERPGILLVHKDRHTPSDIIVLDDTTRNRLSKRTKVIGVGNFGAYFIRELDPGSMLGGGMHISHTTATLDDPLKPENIGQGLPIEELIKLYEQETVASMLTIAAFDNGSTAMQMAQGVARVTGGQPRDPCRGAHWTVAIQGNFALWGYGLPATQLTAEGRQLFGDLALHMRETPYVQLDQQFPKTEPGALQGQLGCGVTRQTYRFRPTASGIISAAVSADQPVALILNAPYQVGYLARDDHSRPQVTFEVRPHHLEQPGDWTVQVIYFGTVRPETNIRFRLELDYPRSKDQTIVWLVAAVIALVLGLLALARLAVIFRRGARKNAG